jgi:hypothetical protein
VIESAVIEYAARHPPAPMKIATSYFHGDRISGRPEFRAW